MNLYAIVILLALVGGYALEVAANVLNVRALRDRPPSEFDDVLDAEDYGEVADYTRARTRLRLVSSGVLLVVLLAFWWAGGFAALDRWLRGFGYGEVVTGTAYLLLLGLGAMVASLPFDVYGTFVVEERFGFNQTTPRTFVLDRVKGLLLGLAIGGPLLAGVLYFFNHTGPRGWIYAWLLVTAVTLALQYVGPRFLMPLFNDFEPVEDEELRDAVLAYADAVDFGLDDVFVMDASRRSSKGNAMFTGFGRNRRVVLFDTLLERHSIDELLAVVAHEVGHYKRGHILQRLGISAVHTAVLFALLSVFLQADGLYAAFGVERMSVHTGFVFFFLLYSPIELVLSVPLNALSRRHEYEADRFAAETTDQPAALADALSQLAADNLANLTPHRLYVLLNYSHPPLVQRVRALRAMAGGHGGQLERLEPHPDYIRGDPDDLFDVDWSDH